jgi:hypothetical protein
LDLFTLRHSVCYFFCSGSLAVDPVDGTLNDVIALLLSPIGQTTIDISISIINWEFHYSMISIVLIYRTGLTLLPNVLLWLRSITGH